MRIPSTRLSLVAFILGCGSSDGGTTPGADAAAGGADTGAAAAVTYQDVKPIFAAKCVPCHLPGGEGLPFHTLADSYDSANKIAGNCPGKKVGECTLQLVKSGYMPFGRGCSGDPATDSANAACLTAAEQQKLADWIAGGLKEK